MDQFLHAHYFHNVMDGNRSRFEEQFELNKDNPEDALTTAIHWWHNLAEPTSNEDRTLLDWAPFLRNALREDKILRLTENEFEEVCRRVWSIQDHSLRVANVAVGLVEGQHYNRVEKTKALATFLYHHQSANGSSILKVLYHILYGGPDQNLPIRLWEGTTDGSWRIDHLGISALGELVGWALPDKFQPRNNRTSKALRSLGYPVAVHG